MTDQNTFESPFAYAPPTQFTFATVAKALELGQLEAAENVFARVSKTRWELRKSWVQQDIGCAFKRVLRSEECPAGTVITTQATEVTVPNLKDVKAALDATSTRGIFDPLAFLAQSSSTKELYLVGALECSIRKEGADGYTFSWKARLGVPSRG